MPQSAPSRSAELYARGRKVIADGVSRTTIATKPQPIYAVSASGARVRDVEGRELIDFNNNYTSLIHGHSHPAIIAAVTAQLPKGFAYSFGSEVEIQLAELLCARAPAFERIRFCNSGSEAVMNCLKAARAFTGRPKIAKCEGAYHGSYDFAEISLASGPENWGDVAQPAAVPYSHGTPQGVLDDVIVIPYNEPELAAAILDRHGPELAGVLIDPVSSKVGLVPMSAEFLAAIQDACQRHGALLIFDEVIAFRQGHGGTQGLLGVQADLTALGKIIGGGLPIGAIAGRAEVMAVFEEIDGHRRLSHGGTFNANPATMAAGLACMEMMDEAAFTRLNDMGDRLRQQLRQAMTLANAEGQVTGDGSLFRLYLHSRPMASYRDTQEQGDEGARMAELHSHLLADGVYITPYGFGCLSTAMEDPDLEQISEAVLSGLRAMNVGG